MPSCSSDRICQGAPILAAWPAQFRPLCNSGLPASHSTPVSNLSNAAQGGSFCTRHLQNAFGQHRLTLCISRVDRLWLWLTKTRRRQKMALYLFASWRPIASPAPWRSPPRPSIRPLRCISVASPRRCSSPPFSTRRAHPAALHPLSSIRVAAPSLIPPTHGLDVGPGSVPSRRFISECAGELRPPRHASSSPDAPLLRPQSGCLGSETTWRVGPNAVVSSAPSDPSIARLSALGLRGHLRLTGGGRNRGARLLRLGIHGPRMRPGRVGCSGTAVCKAVCSPGREARAERGQ